MALDPAAVHKPFRKLEKLFKHFPEPPPPDFVHDLRTQTRRIEAIVNAFELADRKPARKLLKHLKPIRQRAGKVRDMDVLIDFTSSLHADEDANCRLQLLEFLASRRNKAASRLARKVDTDLKPLRNSLRQSRKLAEEGLNPKTARQQKPNDKKKTRDKSSHSIASSFAIEQEMRGWPSLTEKNIHPFRLKVKEWRYILQLGEDNKAKLISDLGEVKNQIGLWHDWRELQQIAEKVLDHGSQCALAAQIRTRTRSEFKSALATSNTFRKRYQLIRNGHREKNVASRGPNPSVAAATSRLAANQ
jgi:CHAD domain-containing protein